MFALMSIAAGITLSLDWATIQTIVVTIGSSAAAAIGVGVATESLLHSLRRFFPQIAQALGIKVAQETSQRPAPQSLAKKVQLLTAMLTRISGETEHVIAEISEILKEQEARRAQLLQEVTDLTQQEMEVKTRLEQMSKEDIVGILLSQGRQREADRKADQRHDRLNFVLGVLVTAVFTIIAAIIAIATHHMGLT